MENFKRKFTHGLSLGNDEGGCTDILKREKTKVPAGSWQPWFLCLCKFFVPTVSSKLNLRRLDYFWVPTKLFFTLFALAKTFSEFDVVLLFIFLFSLLLFPTFTFLSCLQSHSPSFRFLNHTSDVQPKLSCAIFFFAFTDFLLFTKSLSFDGALLLPIFCTYKDILYFPRPPNADDNWQIILVTFSKM